MVQDDEKHGDGAEEDGERVELVVGDHAGRMTRKGKLVRERTRWDDEVLASTGADGFEALAAVCESARYFWGDH